MARSAPLTCAYKGNGSDGLAAMSQFNTLIGRKADCAVDFVSYASWSAFDSDVTWGIGGWKGSGYRLMESVPLTVTGTSLAAVASGAQDAHFRQLAQTLVADGFANAYVRLGWEFNGSWEPWAANGQTATYIAAFQHVVGVMRAVAGQQFRFVWCTAQGVQQFTPSQAYPGDGYVDVVGVDAYNESWDSGYTVPERMWNSVLNDSWGLAGVVSFAKAHAKPYAFPEWGTGVRPDGHGGGDSPLFIASMVPLVEGAEFAGYWDYQAPDYAAELSGTQTLTGAMAAFMAAFGSQGAGAGASTAIESTSGALVMAHTLATSASSAADLLAASAASPVVSCTHCHVGVVENASRHWLMFVWSTADQPAATLTWSGQTLASSLYDPAAGAAVVRALGTANSITLALTAGKPMVVAVQE